MKSSAVTSNLQTIALFAFILSLIYSNYDGSAINGSKPNLDANASSTMTDVF